MLKRRSIERLDAFAAGVRSAGSASAPPPPGEELALQGSRACLGGERVAVRAHSEKEGRGPRAKGSGSEGRGVWPIESPRMAPYIEPENTGRIEDSALNTWYFSGSMSVCKGVRREAFYCNAFSQPPGHRYVCPLLDGHPIPKHSMYAIYAYIGVI